MTFQPKWKPVKVTILTPVLPSASDFLAETETSVNQLALTLGYYGIVIQWLVAIDGPGQLAHMPAADQVVHLPCQCGVAQARNALLPFVEGDWVLPLDADDLIDQDGIGAIAQRLLNLHEKIGWLAANRVLTTGEKTPHWNDQPRTFYQGDLSEAWTSPFPFHPNSMMVKTSLLMEIGGWPEFAVNEDLALALLLSEHSAGKVLTDVMTRYRVWEKQAVAQTSYQRQKNEAFERIKDLINENRRFYGRSPIQAPRAGHAYGRTATESSQA